MKRTLFFLAFLSTFYFTCKRCDSFEKLANEVLKAHRKRFETEKNLYPGILVKLDNVRYSKILSNQEIETIEHFFGEIDSVTKFFNYLGYGKVTVTDFYRDRAPKSFLFVSNENGIRNELGECASRISYSLLLLSNNTDLQFQSHKEAIFKLSDRLFLRVVLSVL